MLESIFTKFLEAYERFRTGEGGDNFPDHFHCRYLEIYEQDDHCGTHLFQLKVGAWFGVICAVFCSRCHVADSPDLSLGGGGGGGKKHLHYNVATYITNEEWMISKISLPR